MIKGPNPIALNKLQRKRERERQRESSDTDSRSTNIYRFFKSVHCYFSFILKYSNG